MIETRPLATLDEFAQAVSLQKQVWGFADQDLVPLRVFVVSSKIGGQVFGAFDAGKLVAFCLAFPGLKDGNRPYLHSQMLAALPEYRNHGLGRRLKLMQRADALRRGIALMEWTFDPLELKNAYFNIERLGAVMRRFLPNVYGTTSSKLHGTLPTHRLVAEWWMQSPRACAIVEGRAFERPLVEARIEVPSDAGENRLNDPGRVGAIQAEVALQFQKHFAAGLAVIGFERSETVGVYLLGRWEGAPEVSQS
jgi:predicted GNAT superfamily acetyltransferase